MVKGFFVITDISGYTEHLTRSGLAREREFTGAYPRTDKSGSKAIHTKHT